jgi:hypothetical protein
MTRVEGEDGSEGEDVGMGEVVVEEVGGGSNVVAVGVDLNEFDWEERVRVGRVEKCETLVKLFCLVERFGNGACLEERDEGLCV